MRSLIERIRFNMNRFGIPIERMLGHNEFANTPRFNHRSNSCPGMVMDNLRNQLRTPSVTPPIDSNETFIVLRATGGFMTAVDAAHNRNRRTTVQPGTYHIFNRANGMVNVTRTRGVPGSWINPTEQEMTSNQTPTNPNNQQIRVGSRVRVNNNARRWATGELIASFVHGQTYTVKQIRNNGNELLLADVMSWINRNDITGV